MRKVQVGTGEMGEGDVDGDGHAVRGEDGHGVRVGFGSVLSVFGGFVRSVLGGGEVGSVTACSGDDEGEGVGLGEDEGVANVELEVEVELGDEEGDCGEGCEDCD